MTLETLDKNQITDIYNKRMKIDFPPSELKPLDMIFNAMDKGMYECYGLTDNDEILGYVYVIKLGKDYLIDYIATYPKKRNAGLGGILISLLKEKLSDAESIIGEVEDPDFAEDDESRALQTRRIGFYMRNGFRKTNLRACCFGAHFIIIETGEGMVHTEDELRELYKKHYKAILPKKLYDKHVSC